tara:strand:+ start:148 stop:402 length:255 start_codon:yes stop_codon:yes gene_type:complete
MSTHTKYLLQKKYTDLIDLSMSKEEALDVIKILTEFAARLEPIEDLREQVQTWRKSIGSQETVLVSDTAKRISSILVNKVNAMD